MVGIVTSQSPLSRDAVACAHDALPHMWHTYNTWVGDVSRTICRTKGQRSKSHGSFKVLAPSAPWLRPYLMESLHMWHTYNTWGGNVSRTIFRIKGQRSGWHGSFEIFVMSTPWLRPYLTKSLHIWHTYNTRGDDVLHIIFRTRGQGHMGQWSFLSCPLRGFLLIVIYLLCGYMLIWLAFGGWGGVAAVRSLDLLVADTKHISLW